jgi:hypothetical protein
VGDGYFLISEILLFSLLKNSKKPSIATFSNVRFKENYCTGTRDRNVPPIVLRCTFFSVNLSPRIGSTGFSNLGFKEDHLIRIPVRNVPTIPCRYDFPAYVAFIFRLGESQYYGTNFMTMAPRSNKQNSLPAVFPSSLVSRKTAACMRACPSHL